MKEAILSTPCSKLPKKDGTVSQLEPQDFKTMKSINFKYLKYNQFKFIIKTMSAIQEKLKKMEIFFDETEFVVIDNGTGFIKAGFSG